MENAAMILSIAGVIVFGFVLMKRLDAFLLSNQEAMQNDDSQQGQALRIAFSNLSAANGMADALERFSKRFPKIDVRLYVGDADAIVRMLDIGDIDVAILPSSACDKILPIEDDPGHPWVVWRKNADVPAFDALIMEIKNDLRDNGGILREKML